MCVESVDDSSKVEGIDLGTFGQPIGPPPGFSGNDDEHDNYHDINYFMIIIILFELWSYILYFRDNFCLFVRHGV